MIMDHQFFTTVTALYLVMALSVFWYMITTIFSHKLRSHPLPPGPRGLPVVGYLPFFNGNLLHKFRDLALMYGPIYKLRLGTKLYVVISSPSLAKEVVRDHDAIFANRDPPIAAQVTSYGGNDIVWSPLNSNWRLLRKFFVREMQSNSSLDATYGLRKDEVRRTIRNVYNRIGQPVDIGDLSFSTEINVIMNMLWGGTIEGDEGERLARDFRREVPKIIELQGEPNISDFFPILAGFDFQGVKKKTESRLQIIEKIFDTVIMRCKEKLQQNVDSDLNERKKDFLQMILELQGKSDPDMLITNTQLKAMLLDIVAGATDTTTTTVEWAMAELMNNPKTMENVKNELSDVVGMHNIVQESHMSRLRYLEAVIKETLRLHPAAPFLVPRSSGQYATVGGYAIPKNTTIYMNVWLLQRDPSIWENPLEFKPERFLNDNERMDYKGNNFQYMPFGSGRRMCAGLPLAERMVVYLLGSLIHSFEWKLSAGEKLDMTEKFGLILKKSSPLFATPSPRLPDLNLYT